MINVSLNSSGESSFINKIFGRFKSLNRPHRPFRSATTKLSSNFQLILRNFACSYLQRRFCTAAMLYGRNWMKLFCIRKNICSHRKNNLLFLPCNMATVQNLYSNRFESRIFPLAPTGKLVRFPNRQAVETTQYHSPASRNLSAVIILDVSHLKDNVKLELARSKNTFAATTCTKYYNICLLDLRRRVSDWRILTMAHLTRPAVISGVSAGSFPETAAENRA